MLIIARNCHYMMNCYPEAGGACAYARSCFGHDHGFLVAWFLALTYLAIFWANATALPLFARYFLGGLFQVGKLYTLFGYDIYLGEALLTAGAIGLFSLLCTGSKKATACSCWPSLSASPLPSPSASSGPRAAGLQPSIRLSCPMPPRSRRLSRLP